MRDALHTFTLTLALLLTIFAITVSAASIKQLNGNILLTQMISGAR